MELAQLMQHLAGGTNIPHYMLWKKKLQKHSL